MVMRTRYWHVQIEAVTENNNTSFTVAVCFEDQEESEKKLQEIKGIMF